MAIGRIQLRRGTFAALDLGTLYQGEAYYCTDTKQLFIGDGAGAAITAVGDSGWCQISETLTYASASTITVATGAASRFQKGDKIKWTQTTVKYGVIVAVADTVLTILVNTDYAVANAAITDVYISRVERPFGFPLHFNVALSATSGAGAPTNVPITAQATIIAGLLTVNGAATVTDKGTASGQLRISAPLQPAKQAVGACQETAVVGDIGAVRASASVAYLVLENYAGDSWWTNNYVLWFSISYMI